MIIHTEKKINFLHLNLLILKISFRKTVVYEKKTSEIEIPQHPIRLNLNI